MKRDHDNSPKSHAKSIAISTTAILAAAALAGASFIGLFKGPEDMSDKEKEIAAALEVINLKATGNKETITVDCGLSLLEEKIVGKNTFGWTLPIPGSNLNTIHFREDICDGFIKKDLISVILGMFGYGYSVYGLPAEEPCATKYVLSTTDSMYNELFSKDFTSVGDFRELVDQIILDDSTKCNKTLEAIVGGE